MTDPTVHYGCERVSPVKMDERCHVPYLLSGSKTADGPDFRFRVGECLACLDDEIFAWRCDLPKGPEAGLDNLRPGFQVLRSPAPDITLPC